MRFRPVPPALAMAALLAQSQAATANRAGPAARPAWIGDAVGSGAAMGLAVLMTRLLNVDHAFWVVLGVLPALGARGTAPARTFRQEQAGPMIGFLVGAVLVAMIGANQASYWLLLPIVTFVSAYAYSAVGFVAGQAAFTVFAVVLFCILLPQQGDVGFLRVEDVALGGAISLVVGSLQRLGRRWTTLPSNAASSTTGPAVRDELTVTARNASYRMKERAR